MAEAYNPFKVETEEEKTDKLNSISKKIIGDVKSARKEGENFGADAALEISKKAQQVNKEQHDLLEKLKRQEVFESISEIQKVLFDFASCNFNTFRSRWISELYTIDKPSSLDLSQSFNSGEVDIINNIFGLKDKFIRENLLESNGELKSGFNGTELENVIQKSNELFKIMTDERNKLKPRN